MRLQVKKEIIRGKDEAVQHYKDSQLTPEDIAALLRYTDLSGGPWDWPLHRESDIGGSK